MEGYLLYDQELENPGILIVYSCQPFHLVGTYAMLLSNILSIILLKATGASLPVAVEVLWGSRVKRTMT